MQRTAIILAYFFISIIIGSVSCFAQQYPFVHYSPKDGLVSNRVRSIYQDSKGRMYFLTMNGLSIYDGARFTNYTTENGLENDIVNCVMELGDDSIWVATNTSKINCVIKGKLKTLSFNSSSTPVINYLCRNDGKLYAAADEGLFLFHQNNFISLPFRDLEGKDINSYIASIVSVENYLLCLRDPGLGGAHILYLYDCRQKKIVSQTNNTIVLNITQSKNGELWAGTDKGIRQVDKAELLNDSALSFSGIILHEYLWQFLFFLPITLYQADVEKGERKIYLMKSGGAMPFASKKNKASDKYSFSVRRIRDGYWELVIDKTLPKGEYAFTVMGMGMANMDGSVTLFAFAID